MSKKKQLYTKLFFTSSKLLNISSFVLLSFAGVTVSLFSSQLNCIKSSGVLILAPAVAAWIYANHLVCSQTVLLFSDIESIIALASLVDSSSQK